jgi:hypothetical protein
MPFLLIAGRLGVRKITFTNGSPLVPLIVRLRRKFPTSLPQRDRLSLLHACPGIWFYHYGVLLPIEEVSTNG